MRKLPVSFFSCVDSHSRRLSEQIGKVNSCRISTTHRAPAYAKECIDPMTAGSSELLTGEKLTLEQMAALQANKKEPDARCKPEADRLAQIRQEIIAAQQ